VPKCFKDDSKRQWKNGKLGTPWPKNTQSIVTKIVIGDYVEDIYSCAKFGSGVFAPDICEVARESDSATFYRFFSVPTTL